MHYKKSFARIESDCLFSDGFRFFYKKHFVNQADKFTLAVPQGVCQLVLSHVDFREKVSVISHFDMAFIMD